MIRSTLVLFLGILSSASIQAQNQPCDHIANTGELNCIYEIVGTDSCPLTANRLCPGGRCYPRILGEEEFFACVNADTNTQFYGWENLSPGSTAPKWSAPPTGQNGLGSAISSALACGRYYECYCFQDNTLPYNPLDPYDNVLCKSRSCGLEILWTLATIPNAGCMPPQ